MELCLRKRDVFAYQASRRWFTSYELDPATSCYLANQNSVFN